MISVIVPACNEEQHIGACIEALLARLTLLTLVMVALEADPSEAAEIQQSISDWPNNTTEHFADVQQSVRGIVESGQLSIFANGYRGHPGYKLPPAVNLLALAHYFEALDWQAEATAIHVVDAIEVAMKRGRGVHSARAGGPTPAQGVSSRASPNRPPAESPSGRCRR